MSNLIRPHHMSQLSRQSRLISSAILLLVAVVLSPTTATAAPFFDCADAVVR